MRNAVCAFCQSGDEVEKLFNVHVCTNRCIVTMHKSCFESRKSEPYWKKKHASRDNGDTELCCIKTCMGKLSKIRFKEETSKEEKLVNKKKTAFNTEAFEGQCCFHANNGLPCRRAAIQDGACSLHVKKAVLLKAMVKQNEETKIKNSHVDTASNTEPIKKKCASTNTPRITDSDMKVQTMVTPMIDAESQTNSHEENENATLKRMTSALMEELEKAKEDKQALKMQLVHAIEQSQVASMAYRTMEHDYSRLQLILNSQQKETTVKKDALLKTIRLMLDGTVL